MKKILALMLALCMVFALAACGEAASDPSAAPESEAPASEAPASEAPASEEPAADGEFTTIVEGKLTMSTNAQFPPYEMTTDDGGFEGIDVEIATAIAESWALSSTSSTWTSTARCWPSSRARATSSWPA